MKRSLKAGKTAKGVSLAILQPLRHLLGAIPVPGAEAVIAMLLDTLKGFDVSIELPSLWNHTPLTRPHSFSRKLPGTARRC
ncbi:hypothetical protein BS47DRAFT_1356114 [Hydnum rufescens UP504]|uniref:Uncharacterized protein n=1 Tax=Hydnum rufescens UP504 TaxID=1448309 RepID=A0A9P6AD69_9AGAM|nr:hypothetical protein BS47DRAFT_1356114 [Hydnum rufescens UP504]